MTRVQLALNVTDIEAAVAFYEKVFDTPVTKRRDGYANFAIAEPPLKLVLIENAKGGTLNHLGVEVDSTAAVNDATSRFVSDGLTTYEEQGVDCCYARQDKVWITDPDGAGWEFYTVLADSQTLTPAPESTCCATPDGSAEHPSPNNENTAATCC